MKYDVAVIGGGPAGLIAAGRSGELGARVVILEKKSKFGAKLLMTGGGRANITNLLEAKNMASKFGSSGKWILSGLMKFGPEKLIEFFKTHGLNTKIEDNNRVFPQSNQARDVLNILINYLHSSRVDIQLGAEIVSIIQNKDKIEKLILVDHREIEAENFIICTGGKSYPITGSSGDAYAWLKKMGHNIITPCPALTPIIVVDNFVKDLEGLSLLNIKLSFYCQQKKICSTIGDLIFTKNGLSGPAALDISENISKEQNKNLELRVDLLIDISEDQLDEKLREAFKNNKIIRNILSIIIPARMAQAIIKLANINGDKQANSISRLERQQIVRLIKNFPLKVQGVAGYEKAMVTAGGVSLKDVNPKNMNSKVIKNLYLAGEVLDLSGPTGGYNLQACWTTGYLAGENSVK